MTQRFEPGELVNVQLRGVRYVGCDQDVCHGIETPDGNQWSMPLTAVIERMAPPEWPPQPGDIWVDRNGNEWFAGAVDEYSTAVRLVLVDDGSVLGPDVVIREFGPMRLERRRGWTPDAAQPILAAVDWIEQHPDIPVYGIRDHDLSVSYCAGSVAELRRVADLIGARVTTGDNGHMHAVADVDGVRYRAFHVPAPEGGPR
jgi:hypothetical protein